MKTDSTLAWCLTVAFGCLAFPRSSIGGPFDKMIREVREVNQVVPDGVQNISKPPVFVPPKKMIEQNRVEIEFEEDLAAIAKASREMRMESTYKPEEKVMSGWLAVKDEVGDEVISKDKLAETLLVRARNSAILNIRTSPDGASIEIDGKAGFGNTNSFTYVIKGQNYTVKLSREGYKESVVNVEVNDDRENVDVVLVRK